MRAHRAPQRAQGCRGSALLVSVLGALGGGATLGPLANAVLVLLTFASVMAGGELGRRHNLAKARAAGDLSAA